MNIRNFSECVRMHQPGKPINPDIEEVPLEPARRQQPVLPPVPERVPSEPAPKVEPAHEPVRVPEPVE